MRRRRFILRADQAGLGLWAGHSAMSRLLAAPAEHRAGNTRASALTRHGAFLVNGEPMFLLAGLMDCLRCPPELWRDHLLKAKCSGLKGIASAEGRNDRVLFLSSRPQLLNNTTRS